jgi:hypothetical protein
MSIGFLRFIRRNGLALIALFVALGGTSYAAANSLLPRNSVGSPQVVNGSLKTIDLSKKARAALKGNRGLKGATGATGATGAAGAAGAPGSALAFAHVDATGTVDAANSKNVATANLIQKFTGGYCFGGLSFTPKNVVVTPESPGGNFDPEVGIGAGPSSCPAATQVRVFFRDSGGTLTDKTFFMLLN